MREFCLPNADRSSSPHIRTSECWMVLRLKTRVADRVASHCYDNDFRAATRIYLGGRVELSPVIRLVCRHQFSSIDWLSLYFWKNLILLFIVRWFGPLFILSVQEMLLRSPLIWLFRLWRMVGEAPTRHWCSQGVEAKPIEPGHNIVVYADSYGCDVAKQGLQQASDAWIYVKLHPQTTDFPFLSQGMEFLPRHVPLELPNFNL